MYYICAIIVKHTMKKTTHFKGHRWTNDEMKLLIELWNNPEVPVKDIAVKLNVTHYAVLHHVGRMRKQGIRLLKRRAGNFAGRHNQTWTQGEVEYLVRRRNEKATNEEIATELGRTWNSVQVMVNKLRSEDVGIAMRGNGVRRLYDVDALKAVSMQMNDSFINK